MTSWLSPRARDQRPVERKVKRRFAESTSRAAGRRSSRTAARCPPGSTARSPRRVEQAGLLQQDRRLEHVRHRLAHRDDVVGHRRGPEHSTARAAAATMSSSLRASSDSSAPSPISGRRVPSSAASSSTRSGFGQRRGSRDARRPRPAARRPPPRARRSSAACPGRTGENRRRARLLAAGPAGRRRAPRCRWRAATRRRRRGRPAAPPASRSASSPRSSSCSGWRSRISAAVAVSRPWMTRSARRYGSSARAGSWHASASAASSSLILHQPRRHRQLLLQRGDFGEVVRERGVGRAAGGQPDDVGGDVRVAVAVTADPRPGPQDRLARAGPRPASGPAAPSRTSALTCGMTSKNAAG